VALVLGAYLLVMSTNLLMLYLSLELVSLASYVLTAYNGDRPAAEGGMKYLLFGAMSSAVMLYGMSWLYGFTGSLDFTDPAFYVG
jgi:NADH-quinone oxidoreductase subunit N